MFRVIQGCPVNATIAPYLFLLFKEARATCNSIYRGEDAKAILHRHGKSTQAEIHQQLPSISNPPGRSTHELRSDGVAFAGPVGRHLDWWQQGFDVNDNDTERVIRVAKKHGWKVFRPYARGVEYHHLCFHEPPKPYGAVMRARLVAIRATLPRR